MKVEKKIITVSGPRGSLTTEVHPLVYFALEGDMLITKVENSRENYQSALWGLFRSLAQNMVEGVTQGFKKELEISGIGFKAEVKKDMVVFALGFSHPVEYKIPKGIEVSVNKNIITVSGIDKHAVGQTAAEIRALKKPEPYKGKGIKYIDEVIRRKAGKAAVKSE